MFSAQVLRGNMAIEEYKFKTGVISGLIKSRELLLQVLEDAKKNIDNE